MCNPVATKEGVQVCESAGPISGDVQRQRLVVAAGSQAEMVSSGKSATCLKAPGLTRV